MKGDHVSYEDPFDSIPEDSAEEAQAAPAPTVVKTDEVGEGEGKIVLTFKEGAGFDSSWTVVHAASVGDANAILADPGFKDLLDRTKKVASYFRGGSAPAAGQPRAAGSAPQQATEAPGGEKRFCEHGEMVFKSGVAKGTGKPYQLFSCTAPRESQCKAQFLK